MLPSSVAVDKVDVVKEAVEVSAAAASPPAVVPNELVATDLVVISDIRMPKSEG